MIPVRDSVPCRTFPFVNYMIIAANIFVFAVQIKTGFSAMIDEFAFYPAQLTMFLRGYDSSLRPVRNIYSSMFMHGGIGHIIGNMLYLYIFGDNVEDRIGHFRYLLVYLFWGTVAVLLHYYFNSSSPVPTIGASGAVAGVMGAYFIFYPRARVVTLIPLFIFIQFVEIPAFFFLVFWFLMQFLLGAASVGAGHSDVAWWAHVGGFAAGAAVAMIYVTLRSIRRLGVRR